MIDLIFEGFKAILIIGFPLLGLWVVIRLIKQLLA